MRMIALVLAGCGHIGFQIGDGAVSDGARDGTDSAAAACPAFATFCDGFETGDFSRWSQTYATPGATLEVQLATVHGGAYALRGTVPAGTADGDAASALEEFPEQTTGMLAVREWVFEVQPLVHYDGVIVLEAIAAQTPSLLAGGDPSMLWDVTENSVTASYDHATATSVPLSTWFCLELDYTFGSPSLIALYVDDSPVLQVVANDPAPKFGQVYAGAARSAGAYGNDTIVDDVVIAHQHIGCL